MNKRAVESESDPFITLFLRWVCLCELYFVCGKLFLYLMDDVFWKAIVPRHCENFVPFLIGFLACNGNGNHSNNINDKCRYFMVVGMVGGVVYHNISIRGVSVNSQLNVIVASANRQAEVWQSLVYFFRYFEF